MRRFNNIAESTSMRWLLAAAVAAGRMPQRHVVAVTDAGVERNRMVIPLGAYPSYFSDILLITDLSPSRTCHRSLAVFSNAILLCLQTLLSHRQLLVVTSTVRRTSPLLYPLSSSLYRRIPNCRCMSPSLSSGVSYRWQQQ